MFWADHAPPHFHAIYGARKASIDIRMLEVLADPCLAARWY
ncbi:MAG: DUF4160 domain-containing protein [bacterium]